jgi:carboxypeptidase D
MRRHCRTRPSETADAVSTSASGLARLLLALPIGLVLVGAVSTALAAGRGEPGPVISARVALADRLADLKKLHELDLDVDAVFGDWARVYVVPDELRKLLALGFDVDVLPAETAPPSAEAEPDEQVAGSIPAAYHTYDTLSAELQAVAAAHPGITRLSSLGPSVAGRELWMMKITDQPDLEEDEPEVAYISSMHGDEVVGQELLLGLIQYLVQRYGSDPRVTSLVDGTEIWIMPSMNPDGTALVRRYNANGFDLNRDFPDQFVDPINTPDGRQPETRAVMLWTASRAIDLAANFHGGALVVNYPFDGNPTASSTFSPTPEPDHSLFVSISRTYADLNPPMSMSNSDPAFDDGITNGADWYAINGGMQDWAYVWYGSFEVTIELDDVKWPPASRLPELWDDNLESMLAYLERVHEGLRGTVTDGETGVPLSAEILLDGDPFASRTDPDLGDYHRPALPGSYSATVAAPGYASQSFPAVVAAGPAARHDVALMPLPTDLAPTGQRIEDGLGGNGALDPGETAALAVTLYNSGRSADGLVARLLPTGWFAEPTRAEASYPQIALGASAESLAPHHEVHLAADVPAGHKVGLALEWATDVAAGVTEPLFLPVGPEVCETVWASDLPQAIVDFGVVASTLDVASDLELTRVRVPVDIRHTYIGDLRVTLLSPSGLSRVLHNGSGGASDDIVGTYGDDLVPFEPLDALGGESALGAWTLEVRDQAVTDSGSLEAFGLELCGRPFEGLPPEMRFRDLGVEGQSVRLDWWPYPGLSSYRVWRSTDPSDGDAFADVTAEDPDPTDTTFVDREPSPLAFYLVSGVGPRGEGPLGHFGR